MPDSSVSHDPEQIEAWRRRVDTCEPVPHPGRPDAVLILLAFDRMWTTDVLARSALKAGGFSQVIVSNNNPEHRLADWITVDDARLRLIDQPERCGCGKRFEIAREADSDLFVAIDDDVFLEPAQITALLQELRADPSVPHGVQGSEAYVSRKRNQLETSYYACVNQEVDVLHTVYAFSRQHLDHYFENLHLARSLGLDDLEICDDILLSHAADARPRIHDLGSYLSDPSWDSERIAVFKDPRYGASRDTVTRVFLDRHLAGALPAQQ